MAARTAGPLPVLFSRSLGRLRRELELDIAASGAPNLALWSNVLRVVGAAGDDGLDERSIPEAARISRRLATTAVTAAIRRGWLRADGDSKHRIVRLTDAGESGARWWMARLGELDGEWTGTPLRIALEDVVGRLPLELPHYPASYGAADPSATGAPYVPPAAKGGARHGADWKPVPRIGDDTVSTLPITALLSQGLMAFTVDYEAAFPWPLASTLTILCHLGSEPIPILDARGPHGITGNGKSLLERHLIVGVQRGPDSRKMVALTDRGIAVVHHHGPRLKAVEDDWTTRFGGALVARLCNELAAVAESAEDLPEHAIALSDHT